MPFADIRLAVSTIRERKAALAADVTWSLMGRLGKRAAVARIVTFPQREDANVAVTPQ